jgi:drug/metabolite transporter (DMT)-like permease
VSDSAAPPPPPPPPPGGGSGAPPGRQSGRVVRMGGRSNPLGLLSVLFGIVGVGCCCCPWLDGAPLLGGVPAMVLGFLHIQRVRRGQATMPILGWIGVTLGVLALCLGAFSFTDRFHDVQQDVTPY